jgi:4'-phosphopantetheinyl transferase
MADGWCTVSSVPLLRTDVVHVWCVAVEALAPCASYFDGLLDQRERDLGAAFHAVADRTRHVVARGALRSLIGQYLDITPRSVTFGIGAFGKPHCAGDHRARITFNISHSGDIVLLAFARSGEIGVDVERWNPRLGEVERTRISASVFTGAERAGIQQLSSAAEREAAFYALWSRKEAYLKGTGAGIAGGLAHVEISVEATVPRVADGRDPLAVRHWALRDVDVGPGYTAALASSPPARDVVLLVPSLQMFDR